MKVGDSDVLRDEILDMGGRVIVTGKVERR
jgi:hypothetical protein